MRTETITKKWNVWGTKFHADLLVDGVTVTLSKGYVTGPIGFKFTIADQPIGFGISNFDFWIRKDETGPEETWEPALKIRAFVTFDRLYLLLFSIRKVVEIGCYTLELPRPDIHTI